MDKPALASHTERLAASTQKTHAQQGALQVLELLHDPDVRAALTQAKDTSRGYPFASYVLAADKKGPPALGRIEVEKLALGQPSDASRVRDVMLSIREALNRYERSFTDLPDAQGYQRITPTNGETPFHVRNADYRDPAMFQDRAHQDLPKVQEPFAAADAVRYLDADQRAALTQKLDQVRIAAAISLSSRGPSL